MRVRYFIIYELYTMYVFMLPNLNVLHFKLFAINVSEMKKDTKKFKLLRKDNLDCSTMLSINYNHVCL